MASTSRFSREAIAENARPLPALRFDAAGADAAFLAWGCNCGPAALAAVLGVDLERARVLLPAFAAKGYTTTAMMRDALDTQRVAHSVTLQPPTTSRDAWPRLGLARVQWEGSWMQPGVPPGARASRTHWVAAATRIGYGLVFDVNALEVGGWVTLGAWVDIIVPEIVATLRGVTGWHLTDVLELVP